MSPYDELTSGKIEDAARLLEPQRSQTIEALRPKVRAMIIARLCPTPGQFDWVDEITQAVLLDVIQDLPKLRNRTPVGLRSFASRIVQRKVADQLRRHRPAMGDRKRVASLDSAVAAVSGDGPLWQLLSISITSPISAAHRADQVSVLMAAMGNLKAEHRDVITYAFFDQLPTSEIAERMNISRAAASMLLIRAVKALRRLITGSSQLGS